jgi:hypothetical protein
VCETPGAAPARLEQPTLASHGPRLAGHITDSFIAIAILGVAIVLATCLGDKAANTMVINV